MFQLGRYQVTDSQSIAGMINPENTLDAMYKRSPQRITNMMIKLLAINRGRSLEALLNMFPTHEIEDDRDFYWELIGSSRRNIPLVEARYLGSVVSSSDFNVGQGGSRFELVFEENWFFDGETIVGNKNELYPVRIVKEPKAEGTNFVLEVEIFGGSPNGIPGEELVRGTRWSVEYAAAGRGLSRDQGGVRRVTPISMRGDVSTLRISHKIAGNAQNKKVAIGIPVVDKAGNKKSFASLAMYEDWLVEQEFSVYKNRALMFGRTNRDFQGEYHNIDKSGWQIKMGSGIREQMEYANNFYYDGDFDLDMLEEILLTLSEGKLGFAERTFMLRTGERGAHAFHKAVLVSTSGWASQVASPGTNKIDTISKTTSELHKNSLKAGFQFVEYLAPNGVTVKIEVDDFYDDKERNKIRFPGSRGVAESYRYDIFYIGTPEAPNIQKVRVKGQEEYRGYRWGFRNPFTGQANNGQMSHDEDSAIVTKFCQLATIVFDPSRTAQIIPEVLAS
jgi:hypothetical protein